MKRITLQRVAASAREIVGELVVGDHTYWSLERPWLPDSPGGRSKQSCVPAGIYALRRHTRPNGDKVLALINPGLGVFYQAADRPSGVGRFLILIHAANYVEDIEGCIAPGDDYVLSGGRDMVTNSRRTMQRILGYIGNDDAEIEIIGSNTYTEAL